MPLKLKVFLRLAFNEKLQMGFALKKDALKKKERKGKKNHIFCGVPEAVNHVFFQCFVSLHSFNWCCFKETLGRDRIPDFPVSMRDLHDSIAVWGQRTMVINYSLLLLCARFGVWTTRNQMNIEHVFPNCELKPLTEFGFLCTNGRVPKCFINHTPSHI
jgi:hypothetical protein